MATVNPRITPSRVGRAWKAWVIFPRLSAVWGTPASQIMAAPTPGGSAVRAMPEMAKSTRESVRAERRSAAK
jgi:hypothetical protein